MKLPANTEAEHLAIGTALSYPETLDDFVKLQEKDFVSDRNKEILRVIKELYREKGAVEMAEIPDKLKDAPVSALLEYANLAYSATAMKSTIETLRENTRRRTLLKVGNMLQEKAAEEDIETLLAKTAEYIEAESVDQDKEPELLADVVEKRIENYLSGVDVRGIPTGLIDLDRLWAGFFPGELTVLAGRPSIGKTATCQHLALHVAKETQEPVMLFSLEMANDYLADRYIASFMKVDVDNLRRGYVSEERIKNGMKKVIDGVAAYLYLHDEANLTTFDVLSISRKIKRQQGLSLIVVDFLTLLADQKERGESEHLKVANMTRRLRDVAKKLNVPVLILAQLNRGIENRQEKRPNMSDIRESGGIEEAADNILLLYRDEYYNPETTDKPNVLEIIVGKQKQGPRGVVAEVGYDAATGILYNLSRRDE